MNISTKYEIGQLVEAKYRLVGNEYRVGDNIFGIIKSLSIDMPHSSEEDGIKYQISNCWVNESDIVRVIEDR